MGYGVSITWVFWRDWWHVITIPHWIHLHIIKIGFACHPKRINSDTTILECMLLLNLVTVLPLSQLTFLAFLTHLPLVKMAAISQTTYSNTFPLMKIFEFEINIHWNISIGSIWLHVSFGSGNGLGPNRRQVIIWTNADPIHWCQNAAVRRRELMQYMISLPNSS